VDVPIDGLQQWLQTRQNLDLIDSEVASGTGERQPDHFFTAPSETDADHLAPTQQIYQERS
jgi:hypothetical protein